MTYCKDNRASAMRCQRNGAHMSLMARTSWTIQRQCRRNISLKRPQCTAEGRQPTPTAASANHRIAKCTDNLGEKRTILTATRHSRHFASRMNWNHGQLFAMPKCKYRSAPLRGVVKEVTINKSYSPGPPEKPHAKHKKSRQSTSENRHSLVVVLFQRYTPF